MTATHSPWSWRCKGCLCFCHLKIAKQRALRKEGVSRSKGVGRYVQQLDCAHALSPLSCTKQTNVSRTPRLPKRRLQVAAGLRLDLNCDFMSVR
jgi:hypothetical protein